MVKEKNINEITDLWKEEKKKYVKKSTYAAYQLLIQNHIKENFGKLYDITEEEVQKFALKKLDEGLSEKTIRDIIIVIKIVSLRYKLYVVAIHIYTFNCSFFIRDYIFLTFIIIF